METGASNKNYSLFDLAALKKHKTQDYDLSIQLGLNGFSFCIKHKIEVLAIQSYNEPLNELIDTIKNHNWLNQKYKSININLVTNKHTLIPSSLFDINNQEDYLKFNNHNCEKNESLFDKLKQIPAHQLYAISHAEKDIIQTFFPKAQIKHFGSTLIDILSTYERSAQQVFISVKTNVMSILVMNKKGLLLFNTFQYQSAEDFIYYILFVLEQLNFNPNTLDLSFLGEIYPESELYKLTYKYIRNIKFIKRTDNIQLSPVINEIPDHFFFTLLHQNSCV